MNGIGAYPSLKAVREVVRWRLSFKLFDSVHIPNAGIHDSGVIVDPGDAHLGPCKLFTRRRYGPVEVLMGRVLVQGAQAGRQLTAGRIAISYAPRAV